MKFGRNFPQSQVLEWAAHYADYKDLKKLVSLAAADARSKGQDTADLTEFLARFDRDLDHVYGFYGARFAASRRRLSILKDRFGSSKEILQAEMRELLWALLKMRGELENLLWFGEVNRKALVRITRSSAIKIPRMRDMFATLENKVDDQSFAKDAHAAQLLVEVSEWLSELKGASRIEEHGEAEAEAAQIKRDLVDAPMQDGVPFEPVKAAIKDNDEDKLKAALDSESAQASLNDGIQREFLQQAISARSKACVAFLLSRISSLDEPDEINQRNFLHRLVLQLARTTIKLDAELDKPPSPRTPKPGPPRLRSEQSALLEAEASGGIAFLAFVLDSLPPQHRPSLKSKDAFGRMPLHYAARFGLQKVAEILVVKMEEWNFVNIEEGVDGPEWHDDEGYSPLHLTVISDYPKIALAILNGKGGGSEKDVRRIAFSSGDILILATKFESSALVSLLLRAGVDVNWQDKNGDSALLVAARLGYVDCLEAMLNGSSSVKVDLGVTDKVFGRGPLHTAAVYGQLPIVQHLVAAGVDLLGRDNVGWTAKEHASFRGYKLISRSLHDAEHALLASNPELRLVEDRPIDTLPSLAQRKPFSHLVDDKSVIIVSLGSLIPSKKVKPVVLDTMPLTGKHISGFTTALSVKMSARDPTGVVTAHASGSGEKAIIDLPILEELSTRPELFYTTHPDQLTVYFDVVSTYAPNRHKLGRAVAHIATLLKSVGPTRTNLHREVSVPMMSADLEIMGNITFSFQAIRPFTHPNIPRGPPHFWHTGSCMVIGHRGLGMNLPATKRLQIGENTIDSFRAAGQLGAHYIEFDVQLSKDGVPIIYHDLLVTESGVDATVFNMTAQGFNHLISDGPATRGRDRGEASSRQRSRSFGYIDSRAELEEDRIKFSNKVQKSGFKANSRGKTIQASFTTLEEVLLKMPADLGINIELKYPDLKEVEDFNMDAYAVELNTLCDTVLTTVFENMSPSRASSPVDNGSAPPKRRPVILSSFSPDVCQTLRFKQGAIPVMFLTDATDHINAPGDVRSSSLQEAVSFAKRWGLLGVVSLATPLVTSPRLIQAVKERGLVLFSYGHENTEDVLVKTQVERGIDGIITDELVATIKALSLGWKDAMTDGKSAIYA